MNSAFFGLSHVPEKTLTRVAEKIDEYGDWDNADLGGLSREDYLREHPSIMPLMQGIPDTACVFPECKHFGVDGAMKTIGFHPGFPEEHEIVMWGAGVEMVSLIFQMCSHCGTFYVSNQCI
ncbi:hypothetical protein [Fuerstiella marisgermanici]|nr:hypothetical protein [Fuerstiella marisgermanici]